MTTSQHLPPGPIHYSTTNIPARVENWGGLKVVVDKQGLPVNFNRAPFDVPIPDRPLPRRTPRTGRTILTPRKWARRCMWDAVGLNCIIFGFLILAILWSGQVVQAMPSTK